jgi:succinyl-diaminopimelate desuccinylase
MAVANEIKNWKCEDKVAHMTSELIRMPSENPPGDMRGIANYIREYLNKLGLVVNTLKSRPGLVNVIGKLDAGKGPTLILNGHMDVVPVGERNRWSWDPFGGELKNGYVLGRGASDMKGGLASLLVALEKIVTFNDLKGSILFMAVPDEETGGDFGTRFLLEKGYLGDACLVAEPSGQNPTIGQKGNIWLHAVTEGVSTHGSLSPIAGENAIRIMQHVIEAVYTLWNVKWPIPESARALIEQSQKILRVEGQNVPADMLDRVSVNVGRISGGEKVNIVPNRCEAEFDIRVPIGISTEKVLNELDRHINALKREKISIKPKSSPNEANYTDPLDPFVKIVTSTIERITGKSSNPVLQWASSDSRFFRHRGIPTVQYGPAELDGIHGVNERVGVKDLSYATRVYALLAHTLLSNRENQVAR